MKSFSLKKSFLSALLLASFSLSQALANEKAQKDDKKQTVSENLLKIQPSINSGVKTAYKIAKKSVGPVIALYLFMKYVSPLGKQCFGSKKEETTQPAISNTSLNDFSQLDLHQKLNRQYAFSLANKDDKSTIIKVADKILDALLSVFIMDTYIKPPLKTVQETLQSYVEKAEERLGLA